ncbi:MAG: hypothetical protein ACOC1X_00205 [Promethearchaeota archaeon]
MFNELRLNPLEEKKIESDVKQLTTQGTVEIDCYVEDSDDIGGIDDSEGYWEGYDDYDCTVEEVSKLNIKRYDAYGDIKEGDIIVDLPSDTDLKKDAEKYRIKYNDKVYESKTGLQELRFYHRLVGEL